MVRLRSGFVALALACVTPFLFAATPPSYFPVRVDAPPEVTEVPPTPNEALGYDFFVITAGPGGGWDVWINGPTGFDECFIHFDPAAGPPWYYEVKNSLGVVVASGWTHGTNVTGPITVGATRIFFGTPNADTIPTGTTSSTQSVVFGFDGADIITGGAGTDYVFAMDGDDRVLGGGGNDVILCGEGADGPSGYEIKGDDGDDKIWGEGGIDWIYGGKGSDWIILGDGSFGKAAGGGDVAARSTGDSALDKIWGGPGDDLIYGDQVSTGWHTTGGEDHIWSGGGTDEIYGGPGGDKIYVQQDGNDIEVCGDGGIDEIHLELNQGDVFGEWLANETIQAGGDFIYAYNSDWEYRINCGMGDDRVFYGGLHSDTILGCGGLDTIDGGEDIDILNGDGGATGAASGATDYVYGQDGIDDITGEAGNDWLYGGLEGDDIHGGAGDDTIYGETGLAIEDAGDDDIWGGADGDTIYGEGGDDNIYGNAGIDTLYGDAGGASAAQEGIDQINGGADGDTIFGGGGDDYLAGHDGADTMWGEGGIDLIWGDGENDVLHGGTEDDEIDGGAGEDKLYGENGADTLIDRSGTFVDLLVGGADADKLDCFDNPLALPDPDARPDNVSGNGATDEFWIDDVDINDASVPAETVNVFDSLLNVDATYKPAES